MGERKGGWVENQEIKCKEREKRNERC